MTAWTSDELKQALSGLPVLDRLRHDHKWAVRDTDIVCSHNRE